MITELISQLDTTNAQKGVDMAIDVIEVATNWGYKAGFALTGSLMFFVIIMQIFTKD